MVLDTGLAESFFSLLQNNWPLSCSLSAAVDRTLVL